MDQENGDDILMIPLPAGKSATHQTGKLVKQGPRGAGAHPTSGKTSYVGPALGLEIVAIHQSLA